MTTEPKPREWWISKGTKPPGHFFWTAKIATRIEDMPTRYKRPVHVIEKSAYDAVVLQLYEFGQVCGAAVIERNAALASNRELREALDGVESILVCAAISPKEQLFDICETALKRASEALAKAKGE